MKSSYQLLVLKLIGAIFILNENFQPTFAAPTATLDNEIPLGKYEDEVRIFRENYAQRMKSYMNTSVDPCDDFYEYACGNFGNAIEYIETVKKRSNLLDLGYIVNELIDVTLQKRRHSEEKYVPELEKAKQLADSCLAATIWPIEPKKEYLEVIEAIGGFPAINQTWNASNFDWFNMSAHLSRYGINGFVKEEIYPKHPSPPYYELPKFGFGFDLYLENIATKESPGYVHSKQIMGDLLKIYGLNETDADKVIDEVIEFLKEVLAALKKKNSYGHCEFLSLIDNTTDFTRWHTFFDIAWAGSEFNESEYSECPCDWFYHQLDKIIAKRPAEAANYMALKFLFSMHPQVKSSDFQRTFCLGFVKQSFPQVLAHFYMLEHFNTSIEADINEIISELKHSMRDIMETSDWLDDPTRLEALEKIRTLRTRIGQVVDPVIETYIKQVNKLNLTNNFAANVLEMAKFRIDMKHYAFMNPDLPEDTAPYDLLNPLEVNAFYYILDNTINVMAGILHPPVYHQYLPKSLTYGSLGYILGHELTHGFDNIGSNFDSNLTLRNWWSENASDAFNDRMNCFAQHYSAYSIPELNRKINGTTSLDENIADSGGLREALAAYRRVYNESIKNNKMEEVEMNELMPGLNMTREQQFFLSFAQVYCSKYDMKHYWVEISSEHPLDKYRVMGSLQNFEEFPLVYNCPLGSQMNPNEKCRLW